MEIPDASMKTNAELADIFEENWRSIAEFFAECNWPDTALGRAAADLNTRAPQIIAALRQPSSDKVLVPREPTANMRLAGCNAIQNHYMLDGGWCGLAAAQEQMILTWDAMLSAAEAEGRHE